MAIPPIGLSNVQAQTLIQPPAQARQKAQPAKTKALAADTVRISTAAAALQNATEAAAQIVQAASAGDLQAKAQLAKPASAPVAPK
jgi:hypothetical protein